MRWSVEPLTYRYVSHIRQFSVWLHDLILLSAVLAVVLLCCRDATLTDLQQQDLNMPVKVPADALLLCHIQGVNIFYYGHVHS